MDDDSSGLLPLARWVDNDWIAQPCPIPIRTGLGFQAGFLARLCDESDLQFPPAAYLRGQLGSTLFY